MAKKSKIATAIVEAPAQSINVQDRDNTITQVKPKRNLNRFIEATGKSEADYDKWAKEVGKKMHIGTLDRLVCEKFGVYVISHLSLLPSELPNDIDFNDSAEIIDNTRNPYELAKMWQDTKANAESWVCKESVLAEKLNVFPKEDFERWGDKNYLSDVSKKWFDKDAIHLDVAVETLNCDSSVKITIEDVIEFVKTYKPNTYKNPMQLMNERIEARFKEVTTFRIKDYYVEHLVKACEYSNNEITTPF